MSVLDTNRVKKAQLRGKARASSTSFVKARRVSPAGILVQPPSIDDVSNNPHKRRKSEPEPDAFKSPPLPDHHHQQQQQQQIGLGVSLGDTWPKIDISARPGPRRTISDNSALTSVVSPTSRSRSPTPPPVPLIPGQYRPLANPTAEGDFFGSLILFALRQQSPESLVHPMLASLGVTLDDIESLKGEFGQIYDRWRVERGLSNVNLAGDGQERSVSDEI